MHYLLICGTIQNFDTYFIKVVSEIFKLKAKGIICLIKYMSCRNFVCHSKSCLYGYLTALIPQQHIMSVIKDNIFHHTLIIHAKIHSANYALTIFSLRIGTGCLCVLCIYVCVLCVTYIKMRWGLAYCTISKRNDMWPFNSLSTHSFALSITLDWAYNSQKSKDFATQNHKTYYLNERL